ncbi:MAG: NAD(P)/FAD-dependent oxidoreductase, partial [Erysipelotrichaceae bacterium]|nr:NAD(P)/FAD-dependent oxidoreductase [Erysipelotrichaceae bacterium]
MYDVAIIGAGPAGLSCALNLKLHNKNVIWFGSRSLSRKVELSEKIANYPGIPFVSGAKLNENFRRQMDQMELEPVDQMVTLISKTRRGFMIQADNDIYDAKSIVLAVGAVSAKGFPGEDRLLGHGVSYCATCDGFLYKKKTIGVFLGDARFEHEVEYLAGIAEKVYLFAGYKDCSVPYHNVQLMTTGIKSVEGETKVSHVVLTNKEELPLDGLFVLRNAVAPSKILPGLELDGPHIVVNRMAKTNKDGVFACGDCTGRPYQIAKAVGEGNVAAHSVLEYL